MIVRQFPTILSLFTVLPVFVRRHTDLPLEDRDEMRAVGKSALIARLGDCRARGQQPFRLRDARGAQIFAESYAHISLEDARDIGRRDSEAPRGLLDCRRKGEILVKRGYQIIDHRRECGLFRKAIAAYRSADCREQTE